MYLGISNIALGNIFPYAITIKRSQDNSLSFFINWLLSLIVSGVKTGIVSLMAYSFTGDAINLLPLDLFLSGWVITATIS